MENASSQFWQPPKAFWPVQPIKNSYLLAQELYRTLIALGWALGPGSTSLPHPNSQPFLLDFQYKEKFVDFPGWLCSWDKVSYRKLVSYLLSPRPGLLLGNSDLQLIGRVLLSFGFPGASYTWGPGGRGEGSSQMLKTQCQLSELPSTAHTVKWALQPTSPRLPPAGLQPIPEGKPSRQRLEHSFISAQRGD